MLTASVHFGGRPGLPASLGLESEYGRMRKRKSEPVFPDNEYLIFQDVKSQLGKCANIFHSGSFEKQNIEFRIYGTFLIKSKISISYGWAWVLL